MMRPLAVSTGDPGGVGPEVSLCAALSRCGEQPLALFGDADALTEQARVLAGERSVVRRLSSAAIGELRPGEIGVVDVGVIWSAEARSHRPTPAGGVAQLAALEAALEAARSGRAAALVTAPMSKEAVSSSGAHFVGHTEHLARAAGLAEDAVTMMFLGPRLNVALVTTHLSIREAPGAVTSARVQRSVRHLAEALLRLPRPAGRVGLPPRLVVAGLNPHAGENGMFGDEEQRVVTPALQVLRGEAPFADGRVTLLGPAPAETVFREASTGLYEGVVAMLHDQATIASKLLDWGSAVNVTWGLPYVRTSVDHGVGYAAAAARSVDVSGMLAAVDMARQLTRA
jgi:4-hydroxythreonine-4-phosphate dehydrogenase